MNALLHDSLCYQLELLKDKEITEDQEATLFGMLYDLGDINEQA